MSATPLTPPPAVVHTSPLANVLLILDTIAQMAELYPPASVPAGWADALLQIAIRTNTAHQALFGKPLDLGTLKDYTPV